MIQLYNRRCHSFETEQIPGEKWLSWLYETPSGHLALEWLIKRRWYSSLTGFYCGLKISRRLIRPFIEKYHIPIEEALENMETFSSFNDFFTRRLKSQARPFPESENEIPSPGDGRMQVFPQIHQNRVWQIKGSPYRLKDLIHDDALAARFHGGSCILLRLAPVDYHRFHFIESGTAEAPRRIPGSFYSVNPIALKHIREIFCKNFRMLTLLHTPHHGDILYVEVGATSVGSIVQCLPEGGPVQKGQEKGFFKFGGSSILLFFEPGQVFFDQDLIYMSKRGIETRISAGESIGIWEKSVFSGNL